MEIAKVDPAEQPNLVMATKTKGPRRRMGRHLPKQQDAPVATASLTEATPSAPVRDGVNDITAAIEMLHAAAYDYGSENKRKKLAKAMIASRSTIDTYGIIGNWRALAVFADDMAEANEDVLKSQARIDPVQPR